MSAAPVTVLHLTPHLGGGVGTALAALIAASKDSDRTHRVIALEPLVKTSAAARIAACGAQIDVAPDTATLDAAISAADILQVEFWNHPTLLQALATRALPPLRLALWCHVSGLHWPCLPRPLLAAADQVLLTSPASRAAPEVAALPAVDVVCSAAGAEDLPAPPPRNPHAPARFGYLGSLNPSKLHPQFVALLAQAPLSDLCVRMIGDDAEAPALRAQCRAAGRPQLLQFDGYTDAPARALATLDVLVYLLNPTHYGTAENALIEAMAMGVVPIVWNNAAERAIVRDGETGLIVDSARSLAQALRRLNEDAALRARLAAAAADDARTRYTRARLAAAFERHYQRLLTLPKRPRDLRTALGRTPAAWFTAFARAPWFAADGSVRLPQGDQRHALLERTKGSVFHFQRHFADDALLAAWAHSLHRAQHEMRSQEALA